jgi:hypothetical protein
MAFRHEISSECTIVYAWMPLHSIVDVDYIDKTKSHFGLYPSGAASVSNAPPGDFLQNHMQRLHIHTIIGNLGRLRFYHTNAKICVEEVFTCR